MKYNSGNEIILVGRKLPDCENLGIGYLLASLQSAGFQGDMEILNDLRDMNRICKRILIERPYLVGLSLPDGGSSFFALALGEFLRRKGYMGHITAGGGFATLARNWLLERYNWLDSVVRFAGEVPLVMLARSLKSKPEENLRNIECIPGITTRNGDGPPAPVMDNTQIKIIPRHSDLPDILKYKVAHISATRGCPARCAYCGPAALRKLEWQEAKSAGFSVSEIRCAGVGGVRRREISNLCDEMELLYHKKGVRYFYFVDEHLLPFKESEALDYIAKWKNELRRRGISKIGIGCMLRANFLTPKIVKAFQEAGLVRCFLGLELASPDEFKKFYRKGDVEQALQMITLLEDLGVATICNLMLVHPYSTIETIQNGIELLGRIEKGTFEATAMQVYHGTFLYDMISAEGRLKGNPLRYGYTIKDAEVSRFVEIFSRLRGESFKNFSISYYAHDIWLALRLAQRIEKKFKSKDLEERAKNITRDLNLLRVNAYKRALEMAKNGCGFYNCNELIRETRKSGEEIQSKMNCIEEEIFKRISHTGTLYSPMRTAAAYVMKFAIASASLAACYRSSNQEIKDVQIEKDDMDLITDDSGDDIKDMAEETLNCSEAEKEARREQISNIVKSIDPCLSVFITYNQFDGFQVSCAQYYWIGPTYCDPDVLNQRLERIKNALNGVDMSCFTSFFTDIRGEDTDDFIKMNEPIKNNCASYCEFPGDDWYKVVILIDSEGRVVDVQSRYEDDPATQEAIDCFRHALEGLTFPCLANYQVCPEYLIAE